MQYAFTALPLLAITMFIFFYIFIVFFAGGEGSKCVTSSSVQRKEGEAKIIGFAM